MRGNSKNYHFLEGKSSKSSLQILPYSTREKFSAKFLLDAKVTRSQWRLKRLCTKIPPRSQHPAKFSGHKSCESGDINFSSFMWCSKTT